MPIDPETRLGVIRLAVADLERAGDFYRRAVGLEEIGSEDDVVRLGAGGTPVVELAGEPEATPRPPGTTGLFHMAILLPDRLELARALRRAVEANAPIGGASDHLVSEALYLQDPEGNGIEIYCDRPRSEWRHAGGKLQMSTLPLDVRALLEELDGGEVPSEAAAETRLGHVHLNVADLDQARAFYEGALGFEVTVDDYPGALFLAAGGYHHHIGLNTWAGEGAPPPPPGSAGMRWFEVVAPRADEVVAIGMRLRESGHETQHQTGGEGGAVLTADPSGNGVLIRAAS